MLVSEAVAIFAEECASRGIRVEDPRIDINESGAIAGGTFTPIDPKDQAPIWPRIMSAFEATKAWSEAAKRGPETLIETIKRVDREEPTLIQELIGFDLLLGSGT